MKKTLFLTALLGSATALHAAVGDTVNPYQGFVADGVNVNMNSGILQEFSDDNIKASTRFYDSTKGWVAGIGGDSSMCWAHTASNMIQYWQSYYGVFYKAKEGKTLPYGSDYTRTIYKSALNSANNISITDPMRLNVMKALKDSGFQNGVGEVSSGTNWFFTWTDTSAKGGFYYEYFGSMTSGALSQPTTATTTEIKSLQNLKSALLPALGITENNGTYTQTESGLIAHLNATIGDSSHTLTCYGFTTHTDGSIKSVLIADSDDNQLNNSSQQADRTNAYVGENKSWYPKLTQLFIKVEANGNLALYKDEACETAFITDYSYYINGVTQINTPEVLKNMLAEYSDTANEAQVWNGAGSEWGKQTATTEALPTEATGWDINVNGSNIAAEHQGYYHTYATEGRAVLFDDHAAEGKRTVTICGEVAASLITVAAEGYVFQKAESGGSIAVGADLALVNGATLDSRVALNVRDLTLEGNTTIKSGAAIVVTGDFLAALAPQAATFAAVRSTVTPQATVNASLDLRQADSVTLETSVNMNGNNLYIADAFKLVLNMVEDEVIPCFTNIGELYVGDAQQDSFSRNIQVYLNGAETPTEDYLLVYDSALSTLSLMLSIPEPGTATLGLLALATMAARRRRS